MDDLDLAQGLLVPAVNVIDNLFDRVQFGFTVNRLVMRDLFLYQRDQLTMGLQLIGRKALKV